MLSSRRFLFAALTVLSVCLASPSNVTDSFTGTFTDTVADGLLRECWSSGSFSCVQKGLRRALETQLSADFDVTDSVKFVSNDHKYSLEANTPDDGENVVDDGHAVDDSEDEHSDFDDFIRAVEGSEAAEEGKPAPEEGKSASEGAAASHVNGIADILYNRGVRYLMTHDLNVDMPEFMFGGGRVRVQPKSVDEDGGVIVKLNFDEPQPAQPEGRLFLKRIRQIFKKKLMTSFMAAMLIIKLIKVKLMFLLPVIVGVSAAKKILLKVLLFLFPALTHLFKLCAYYHHHHTKLSHHYHHHHGVNHHVHHGQPVYVAPPSYGEYADHPPPGATIIHRSEDNVLSQWGINYEEPASENERIFTQPHTPAVAPISYPAHQQSYAPAAYSAPAPAPAPAPQHAAFSAPQTATFHQNNEDPFYSPILTRLDRVFSELGFMEEPCKERLVCSMYKAPARFSPHSNLVSAEISRDPSELQKPVFESPNVLRYFRYVAAARNGQDAKDCLSLYPNCALLTE